MTLDGRRIAILVGGVLLSAFGCRVWFETVGTTEAPLGVVPRGLSLPGSMDRRSMETERVPVQAALAAARRPDAPTVASVDAFPVLGCDLARAVTGDVLEALIEECTGEGVAWRIRPRDRVLAAVRRNAAPLAVLADRPGVPPPPDLECVELGDLVLVALAPRAAQPPLLTAAQFRRLIDGRYAHWNRASGPDERVEPIGFAGLDAGVVARLFGVEPVGFASGLTARELLDRVDRSAGGLGIASLQMLETARLDAVGRDRMLAIDGIEPSREAYRRGRYPFGVTLRVVASPSAADEARCLLGALRRLGRDHALVARLCAP